MVYVASGAARRRFRARSVAVSRPFRGPPWRMWRAERRRGAALAACGTYALSSIALSLVNKALFSEHAFDFPACVLASQALGTVLCLKAYALLAAGAGEGMRMDLQLLRAMVPVTMLFAAMLGSSSRALRYCSVPVVTIFKNISVALVTVYEWRVYAQPVSPGIMVSLLLMIAGSVVAGVGDMHFSSVLAPSHACDLGQLQASCLPPQVGYGWLGMNVFFTVAHIAGIRAWLHTSASPSAKTLHNQVSFGGPNLVQLRSAFQNKAARWRPSLQTHACRMAS